MFCSNCGNKIQESDNFCSSCGKTVTFTETSKVTAEPTVIVEPSVLGAKPQAEKESVVKKNKFLNKLLSNDIKNRKKIFSFARTCTTVLLCVLVFVMMFANTLLISTKMTMTEDGLSNILNEVKLSDLKVSEDSTLVEEIYDMVYTLYPDYINITLPQLEEYIDKSEFKTFFAKEMEALYKDIYFGTNDAKITEEEISKAIWQNRKLLNKYDLTLPKEKCDGIAEAIVKSDIIESINNHQLNTELVELKNLYLVKITLSVYMQCFLTLTILICIIGIYLINRKGLIRTFNQIGVVLCVEGGIGTITFLGLNVALLATRELHNLTYLILVALAKISSVLAIWSIGSVLLGILLLILGRAFKNQVLKMEAQKQIEEVVIGPGQNGKSKAWAITIIVLAIIAVMVLGIGTLVSFEGVKGTNDINNEPQVQSKENTVLTQSNLSNWGMACSVDGDLCYSDMKTGIYIDDRLFAKGEYTDLCYFAGRLYCVEAYEHKNYESSFSIYYRLVCFDLDNAEKTILDSEREYLIICNAMDGKLFFTVENDRLFVCDENNNIDDTGVENVRIVTDSGIYTAKLFEEGLSRLSKDYKAEYDFTELDGYQVYGYFEYDNTLYAKMYSDEYPDGIFITINTKTGKYEKLDLLGVEENVTNLAFYEDKIYFLASPNPDESPYCAMYCSEMNGANVIMIGKYEVSDADLWFKGLSIANDKAIIVFPSSHTEMLKIPV